MLSLTLTFGFSAVFPSNLNWESSVYGFCNFCLLFLYFSFKIVNIHNIFEGFVWG